MSIELVPSAFSVPVIKVYMMIFSFIDLDFICLLNSFLYKGPAQAQNLRDSLAEAKSDIVVKVIPVNVVPWRDKLQPFNVL